MNLEINIHINIPEEELRFTTSRSGGPGGQNVNKVETKVTLWFDISASTALTGEQKILLAQKLATRINKQGVLWVTSSRFRTQMANREAATERFVELLHSALQPEVKRRRKRISIAAKARRLENKRFRSQVKRLRQERFSED